MNDDTEEFDFRSVGGVMVSRGDGPPEWDFGLVRDPVFSAAGIAAIADAQDGRVELTDVAPDLIAGDDDAPLLFMDSEEKVRGKKDPAWNQGGVGTCVSFGFGRGATDLMLHEIACGEPETDAGDIATEPIYGGSRVEVGGGRINGDGSVGAWAAKWVKDWGVLPRGVYGDVDLTRYSESLSRSWGRAGVPSDLETLAKRNPVTSVALVTTEAEGWAALGAGKPIPVCSNRGFSTRLDVDGFCEPSGSWSHCMLARGRFVHPKRGRAVVIANSWADYMRAGWREVEYRRADGSVGKFQLPPGHFCTTLTVFGRMLAQRDSFALAGLTGWRRNRIDWANTL